SHTASSYGQLVGLADDIIIFSKGAGKQDAPRKTTGLDQSIGARMALPPYDPTGRDNPLAESAEPAHSDTHAGPYRRSLLSAVASSASTTRHLHHAPRQPSVIQHTAPRLYGLLELPMGEWEGPPNGMTLDQAIARLLSANPELQTKRYELPQARADVLTASQRANPLYFVSANNVPYQSYSPGRFGAVQYAPTLIQPFDMNDKRAARTEAASRVVRVLKAQYQNAVRLALHELYMAYTDVIVARETLRYAQVSLHGAKAMLEVSRDRRRDKAISESDQLHLTIQHENARLDVSQAQSELSRTKLRLGALLAIPREPSTHIEMRGRIRPAEPPLPQRDELVHMALAGRPDVQAFRLGIDRARGDAHLAKKERIDDVFLVYSPFVFQNNVPIGKQSVTSFSLGVMGSIPIFDRNQGEIRRAESNVAQSRTALAAIEAEVSAEVESVLVEYYASREAVERIEKTILPASERARAIAYEKHRAGLTSAVEYFLALRDRNDVVRQYRDTLIRHRRSMLQLNTAVGRRLLP
ncbi:MAG: TolC family protein, partial [Pirellulales bacterium]